VRFGGTRRRHRSDRRARSRLRARHGACSHRVRQSIALYPDLTARENLRFFGRLYGLRGAHLAERVEDLLDVAGLRDRGDERIDKYSGGMMRRVNIAAGLLHDPKVLVLDEPTVGVDPQSRHAILSVVEELAAGGMAVLYTTHYMEEAERLCDRIAILDEGHIIAEGSQADLFSLIASTVAEPDLEAVFLHLTGKALRD
jgi:ABC-2 type transport system ATP-binding protein